MSRFVIKKCVGDDAGHVFAYICIFDLAVTLPALCMCMEYIVYMEWTGASIALARVKPKCKEGFLLYRRKEGFLGHGFSYSAVFHQ